MPKRQKTHAPSVQRSRRSRTTRRADPRPPSRRRETRFEVLDSKTRDVFGGFVAVEVRSVDKGNGPKKLSMIARGHYEGGMPQRRNFVTLPADAETLDWVAGRLREHAKALRTGEP